MTAVLTNGTARGTLQIVFTERGDDGFFPGVGRGATASCGNTIGELGPTHFEPQWLFRDNFSEHGQLTSKTAMVTVPTAVAARFGGTCISP